MSVSAIAALPQHRPEFSEENFLWTYPFDAVPQAPIAEPTSTMIEHVPSPFGIADPMDDLLGRDFKPVVQVHQTPFPQLTSHEASISGVTARQRRSSIIRKSPSAEEDDPTAGETRDGAGAKRTRSRKNTSSNKESKRTKRGTSSQTTIEDKDNAARELSLLRNRQAAERCRQKKKAWEVDLKETARELEENNSQLREHMTRLQSEIINLKTQCLQHVNCECDEIRNFLIASATVCTSTSSARSSSYCVSPPNVDPGNLSWDAAGAS